MKKKLIITFMVLSLFTVSGCFNKNDDKKPNNNVEENNAYNPDGTLKPIDKVVDNKTTLKQGDLLFSGIQVKSLGATNTFSATVKNTGTKTSSFSVVIYVKGTDGKILGKASERVESLAATKEQTLAINLMGSYANLDNFEIIVENLESN